MSIHVCQDNPNRINKTTRATYVESGADQTTLRLPSGAAVVSRDSSPAVVRVERVTLGTDGPDGQTVENCPSLDMDTVVHKEARHAPIEAEMHRDASLDHGMGAGIMTVPCAEHGVGVQPVSREVASATASDEPALPVTESVTPPPPTVPPVKVATTEVEPVQGVVPPTATRPSRIKVVLESSKMGRHRIRVDNLTISDSIVVLFYIDDDDATIVEPPISTDPEDTIYVTAGTSKIPCVYYGFTAEPFIDGHTMLMVVLIRTDV